MVYIEVGFLNDPFEPQNLNWNHSKHTFEPSYAKLGVGSARHIATQWHPLPGRHPGSRDVPLKLIIDAEQDSLRRGLTRQQVSLLVTMWYVKHLLMFINVA